MSESREVEARVYDERSANQGLFCSSFTASSCPCSALYLRRAHLSRLFLPSWVSWSPRCYGQWLVLTRETGRQAIFVTPVPIRQALPGFQLSPVHFINAIFSLCLSSLGIVFCFSYSQSWPCLSGWILKLFLHMQSKFPVLISCILNNSEGVVSVLLFGSWYRRLPKAGKIWTESFKVIRHYLSK